MIDRTGFGVAFTRHDAGTRDAALMVTHPTGRSGSFRVFDSRRARGTKRFSNGLYVFMSDFNMQHDIG